MQPSETLRMRYIYLAMPRFNAVDGLRLEVTLGADARYFSMAAVIDEYESLQQLAGVPGTLDAAQNIDPVFVKAETVIDVGRVG